MIDADLPPEEILSRALDSTHTRLPLFRGDPENIVGVIHAKDLLRAMDRLLRGPDASAEKLKEFRALDVARKPYFVPETTTLDDQMREFLRRHSHFALVVDEYGALRGLITLEDILEEIVGEITDEFDVDAEHPLRQTEDGSVLVDGAMTIRDLNRAMDWALPDEEANTIAGLVIHEAQSIPTQGQVFSFHGFRFEVLQRQANRITRLKIRPL
jgi:Mg2+/Co2+ transporter CorB